MSFPLKHCQRLPLEFSSWGVFAIALTLYWITADPGVSFWDCPEYVTAASRLEIGHPPGNPVWMLAMRMATIPFSPENHAYVINLCSGLLMAFASFFLCRILYVISACSFSKLLSGVNACIPASAVSMGGALCFAVCDSAWFSAVEAEVYAMSAMLTGASLWIMVRWWHEESRAQRLRLLFLIAYLTGLSFGVHQLNLLCIPVFVLIILYKKFPDKINLAIVWLWILGGCAIVAFILLILIPGVLYAASVFELFFINNLNCAYNTGVGIFVMVVVALLGIAIFLATRFNHYHIASSLWMISFVLLGFSSFGIIMIRSSAGPFMNEGAPSDIFALESYIARDQYPSSPLIYGHTPYSKPLFQELWIEGKPVYSRLVLEKGKPIYKPVNGNATLYHRSGFLSKSDSMKNERIIGRSTGGYLLSDYTFSQKLTPELDMWFPRITSRSVGDREAYADWAAMDEGTMEKVPVSETIDSLGNLQSRINLHGEREQLYSYRPTYLQNLRFFLSYQAFYMYFRYLLWNFMGRQNDFASHGEIDHGNFITGFDAIDNVMLGPTEGMPAELWKDNAAHNNYYSIPFIIGMAGILWLLVHSRNSRRLFSVSGLFFLMTGIAIVMYLNQSPGEPRERDYTFLGSYMAFAMWISAGFAFVFYMVNRYIPKVAAYAFAVIFSFFPATMMALVNFNDHDRRNRFEPTFYSSTYLDFELPSVIFSHGDNSTFPLWYSYEVLGYGRQHLPIDVTYLGLPSYIANLSTNGVAETISVPSQIAYGAFILTRIPADSLSEPLPLSLALRTLYENQERPARWPTSKIVMPVNNGDSLVVNLHDFSSGSSYLSFKHLMLLDILATQLEAPNPKSLYFPSLIDRSFYKPLTPLLKETAFGKIYNPQLSDSMTLKVHSDAISRELLKLVKLNPKPRYADPVVADRSRRYRGELIISANTFLENGDSVLAGRIVDAIESYFPYDCLSPGSFTVDDSTYYEGKEYLSLLQRINISGENEHLEVLAQKQDSLLAHRKKIWTRYYKMLSPAQRKTLSNRSLRELIQ